MTRTSPLAPDTLAYLTAARNVPTLAYVAVEFAACVSKWATRRQTRRALRQLENWQLDDVGMTPLDAQREVSKAFWQA
ncbi:MAG: DUF1127 domain-containing protein [Pseudomonadota bacterium]